MLDFVVFGKELIFFYLVLIIWILEEHWMFTDIRLFDVFVRIVFGQLRRNEFRFFKEKVGDTVSTELLNWLENVAIFRQFTRVQNFFEASLTCACFPPITTFAFKFPVFIANLTVRFSHPFEACCSPFFWSEIFLPKTSSAGNKSCRF